MAVTCLRSKFDFCKFGNQCEKIHFIDICENGRCVGKQCDKRHPVVCFFFEKYGRCKFDRAGERVLDKHFIAFDSILVT